MVLVDETLVLPKWCRFCGVVLSTGTPYMSCHNCWERNAKTTFAFFELGFINRHPELLTSFVSTT